MWFANHNTPAYLLPDLNTHHTSFDTFDNRSGNILYNIWLNNGRLRRLGPEIGTYTSNQGNLTKPDIVLGNRSLFHRSHVYTVIEERNTSDHAPICLQISDRPIRIPAAEHEIFNQANWDGYTAHLKREVRPFNLNRKNTAEIDTILVKIEIATSSARSTHIPKVKFKYSERNTATPKFHRLQKILAQIYNLMHNNSQNAHILRHLRNKKTQTIIKIKLECAIMQSNFWTALLTEIRAERNLNPKGFRTRIKTYYLPNKSQ